MLFEDFFHGFGLVQILDSNLLAENPVHLAMRVKHSDILFAYDNQSVVLLPCVVHHQTGRLVGNVLTPHHLVAHKAQGTIDGHIAVNQMLDSPQIGDNQRRTPGSYEHLMPIGLGLGESINR